jgi:ankyrin repeat protein
VCSIARLHALTPLLKGRTPLLSASHMGHVDAVRLLLDAGADVEAQNEGGKTALMYAAQYGHASVARLLIERGAALEATNVVRLPPTRAALPAVCSPEKTVRLDSGARRRLLRQVVAVARAGRQRLSRERAELGA